MQLETQAQDAPPNSDLLVRVEPEVVAAGGEVTLYCALRAEHASDLLGLEVQYLDGAGETIGTSGFDTLDGSTLTTGPLVLRAPSELGQHDWRAVFTDPESGEQTICEFAVEVIAHKTSLLVWGAPSAIACGTDFTVTVGLKCSGGCTMAGRRIDIVDESGASVGAVTMGAETLAGTSGLFQSTVRLRAPDQIARQFWQARIDGDDDVLPHQPALARFGLNFVAPPDHRVTIEVTDAETGAPMRGASVVLHPFRGTTDASGIAAFGVCKGEYTMMVSAARHEPVTHYITVTDDYVSQVRLQPEIKEDPDAHWM